MIRKKGRIRCSSTRKSFSFNPERAAQTVQRILGTDEEIIGLFLQAKLKICVITSSRVAIVQLGKNELQISIPMKDISSSVQNDFVNSFVVQLASEEVIDLADFSKEDRELLDTAFAQAHANMDSSSELELSTPSSRVAEYAKIESNMSWAKVPRHLQKNIEVNISDHEKPQFIIATSGRLTAIGSGTGTPGAIVALHDRCILIKSGVLGGFMAGSLGGARVASFYYQDITGIEYNSGMLTGVVEILTASYEGGKNKDYWRGTFNSRNSDSNDPWVLSNCLPMGKLEYAESKQQFNKLRALVGESKSASSVTNVIASESVADEIEKLSKLLERNLIDEDEFKEAKKRLLGN